MVNPKELIRRALREIEIRTNKQFEVGQRFTCSARHFGLHHYLEQILHGLRENTGQLTYNQWDGKDNYRITIENNAQPYYVIQGEVLTWIQKPDGTFIWKKRKKPVRVMKKTFNDLYIRGGLTKI